MRVFDKVDFDEWQEIADRCGYATFFHTPIWSKVFAETYPHMSIVTKKFIFDDGTRAILPLIRTKSMKGLLSSYISNAAGVYGGWISDNRLSAEQINKILIWVNKHLKNITWRLNPFDSNISKYDLVAHYKELKIDATYVLHLKHFNNETELKSNYEHAVRRRINQAIKKGLFIKKAEIWKEWEHYYSIYEEALRKWADRGTSYYPIELFRNFFNKKDPKVSLWLAKYDDTIIGGNLNFYHNNHCVQWHGVCREAFFKFGVTPFLIHNIITKVLVNGYSYYDFNTSGVHEGVAKFKKSFGTQVLQCPVVNVETRVAHFVKRIRGIIPKTSLRKLKTAFSERNHYLETS